MGDAHKPDATIVKFPTESDVERQKAEAQRLAGLSEPDWRFQIKKSAERLGVPVADLRAAVAAIVRDREKKERAAQAKDRQLERKRETEQRRIEKDADRKGKEKTKAFTALIKLPGDQHEAKLSDLAKRLGEDLAALRIEFTEFVDASDGGAGITPSDWDVAPWEEPVATAELLPEIINKIRRYIVARPHETIAIALWTMMAWTHDIAAYHSVYLVVTSAEPDSGKTTLLGVLKFLVPKPFTGAEPTGPSIFRFVDREKPTLLIDEADDLFARKTDVKHIFNAAWTRGTKIPRQVKGETYWFDPFSPKIVGLLGLNLPRTLSGRSIVAKLLPKKPDEKVADFNYNDDEEFTTLRRKLSRWAMDNANAIKGASPLLPPDFGNRIAANWRLLLAIAELAGSDWPARAREAAQRMSRTARKPSWGVRLLAEMRLMFAAGRKEIPSQQVVDELLSDPDGPWGEYKNGAITQRQLADILEQFDIAPTVIHPTKRGGLSRRGYKAAQFEEAFARFLPVDPNIRTSEMKARRETKTRRKRGCSDVRIDSCRR